jgi:hypothetical protein
MGFIMSTVYVTKKEIPFVDLFDGRLKRYGVGEFRRTEGSIEFHYLTDGTNRVSVSATGNGMLGHITRYGNNNASQILDAIKNVFDTAIFSEDQPQYWGFDTQEEMDAAMETTMEASRKRDQKR